MKKRIGLLAASSLVMLAACSDDESSSPAAPVDSGSSTQVTAESCLAQNKVLYTDPATGVASCVDAAPAGLSSSSDANGSTLPTSAQPDAASSSSAPAPAVSSSSVAPVTETSSSAAAPTSTTPPANESDGKWHLGLWDGTADAAQVPTGNETGGYWYSYTDKNDNGLSTLTWDAADDGTSEEGLVPVIKECHGLCGSFNLLAGTNKYKPYVGVGFNYSRSANEVADATPSRGVCVTYTSDIEIILEMGLGSKDSQIGYANPFVTLPAATSPKTMDFSWSEFQQPTWTETKNIVSNPEKALASLKFKFAGEQDSTDGGAGKFTIMKVGAPDECR